VKVFISRFLPVAAAFQLLLSACHAQRASGETADIDPLYLIDTPVAGILPTTSGAIEANLYPEGGLLLSVVYGLRKNLNVGMSFGGTRIIGSGGITWNRLPEIMVRYRLYEETDIYPALVLGFDSQGRDGYVPSDKQYAVKGPGFFVAASKNYALLGWISFHGGLNYSIERADRDGSPNLYLGMEKTIGPIVSALGEYNFAFDNDKNAHGFWNGNLGLGIRIATRLGFSVDLLWKNLLTANPYYPVTIRELKIQYVRYM